MWWFPREYRLPFHTDVNYFAIFPLAASIVAKTECKICTCTTNLSECLCGYYIWNLRIVSKINGSKLQNDPALLNYYFIHHALTNLLLVNIRQSTLPIATAEQKHTDSFSLLEVSRDTWNTRNRNCSCRANLHKHVNMCSTDQLPTGVASLSL